MKVLRLHLKTEYWHEIKRGDKIIEYRERTPYWYKRLHHKWFDIIHICKGYPKLNDFGRIIIRVYRGYRQQRIDHPHFGGIAHVYSIPLTEHARKDLDIKHP